MGTFCTARSWPGPRRRTVDGQKKLWIMTLKISMQCWIARDNPLYFDVCGAPAQNPIILP